MRGFKYHATSIKKLTYRKLEALKKMYKLHSFESYIILLDFIESFYFLPAQKRIAEISRGLICDFFSKHGAYKTKVLARNLA